MLLKTPNFEPWHKNGYTFIMYKQIYQPFTMVPCGIFETRISAKFLLKIWLHMLCNQFRHATSYDLKVLYAKQIFIDILNILYKQIHPVVYFLPVTIVQKQEKLSIYL